MKRDAIRVLVVDLEATCWSREDDPVLAQQQNEVSEIIEIGAVALGADLGVLGEFQRFVRPHRHPRLSAFCTKLTSITQEDVDAAEPFPAVWSAFNEWMGGESGAGLVFVSWSRYDHRQLMHQCRVAGLQRPRWDAVDAKVEFTQWVRGQTGKRLRFGMARALAHLGIEQSGTAHRGIDDARNLVKIFQHIRDPSHLSERGREVLSLMVDRHPLPTHVGHLRELDRWVRQWFPPVRDELIRLGLVRDLGLGRGLEITPSGVDVITARW